MLAGINPTPQPPDERPREPETVTIFQQPPDEIPTPTPTGTVDVHILQPTRSPTTVAPFSCSQDGQWYREGQFWKPNPCTNCSCTEGQVKCQTDLNCARPKGKSYLTNLISI